MASETALAPVKTSKEIVDANANSRVSALESMNTALRKVHDKAEKLLNKESECVIRSRHQLGKLVAEVFANSENKYGTKAMTILSVALSKNQTILYGSKKFAELYDDDDAEKLIAVRNTAGQPLCWSHIETLISIDDSTLRDTMLTITLDKSLTPSELSKKITEYYGGARSNSPGRTLTKPKTFLGYLDQINTTVSGFMKKSEQVWLGGDKTIKDSVEDLEKIDDSLFEKLQETQDRLSDLVTASAEAMEELNSVREALVDKKAAADKIAKKAKKDEIEDDDDGLPIADEDLEYVDVPDEELVEIDEAELNAELDELPEEIEEVPEEPVKKKVTGKKGK